MDSKLKLDPRVDYGSQLNLTVWMLVSVSALFLFTRLYLKNCQNRGLWWDDYALLVSWICLTADSGITSFLISLGYGKQVIAPENAAKFPLAVNFLSTLLISANIWGKISFAMTLMRIPVRRMRITLIIAGVIMVGTLAGSAVMVWVECFGRNPRAGCVPTTIAKPYNLLACAYSAAMDVGLAFLPWKYIWTLQMSMKEKIGVVVAMSMGVFAGIAAIVKTRSMTLVGSDPTSSIQLVAWGNAEAAICIMAASIPILRALFRGNVGPGAPIGYQTGETSMMTESGPGNSGLGTVSSMSYIQHHARIFSRQAASPPITQRQVNPRSVSLEETLTSGSPEPGKSGNNNGADRDDWSDEDSIELSNYQARPETPTDFTRRGIS